jgi:F0F1-type ATP synthase assembly protein I
MTMPRATATAAATKRAEMPELKQITLIHTIVVLILALPLCIISPMQQGVNCLLGGALIGLNITTIVWSMKQIFVKKSIAMAGFVIVIKYAAFIAILMALYASGWRANFGFILGLSAALPTVAWSAYKYLKQGEMNGSF